MKSICYKCHPELSYKANRHLCHKHDIVLEIMRESAKRRIARRYARIGAIKALISTILTEKSRLQAISNAADVMCHEAFTLWSAIVDSDETSRDLKDRAWDYFKQTRDERDTHRNNARYGKGINPYTLD